MHLRSLTLKGFKSFAEPATLELEPGVTVVVGPNGSGKSNVVDAMAWVLGAQAPSAVRSQKMDDVIFAGTSKRPALGRAEVKLTIDNADGRLPVEFSEVTISRTLFRTGESEYAINGVSCRLLDIQELLSDGGVGRQQHVIVSQGQIDAVLNARPEDRRSIIEEAAGVLKHRKRKEKAERRLEATEANLLRVQDLLREVRRQLRPLEKQAEAARRHGELFGELRTLQVYVAGREIAGHRTRLEQLEGDRRALAQAEGATREELAGLDTEVLATEARLSALGGFAGGEQLARAESLREKARGLAALLAERRRGVERELAAQVSADVVAGLEADLARTRAELAQVEDEALTLGPEADRLATAEADLAAERAAFDAQWREASAAAAAPRGAAAEVRGELGALRSSVQRGEGEAGRVRVRLQGITDRVAKLAAEADRLRADAAAAQAEEGPLVAALDDAEARLHALEERLAGVEDASRAAEADRNAWQARVEALALALDEARSRAGAERLAAVDGVLGTLVELVAVDAGWEAAFAAGAGEALAAVCVDGADGARRALAALHDADLGGAVLAVDGQLLLGAGGGAPPSAATAGVGEALRPHVRGRSAAVDALLDTLLGGVVVVRGGWAAALDVAQVHPHLVVVTGEGHRFAGGIWRLGAAGGGAGATAAALDEARERAAAAAVAADAARAELRDVRAALQEARTTAQQLTKRLDAHDARLTGATDGLARTQAHQRDAATEAEALQAHLADLTGRVERERARVAELEGRLPALEAEEQDVADQARRLQVARARLEERAGAVGALRTDLNVRAAGLEQRRAFLQRRTGELEQRLERHAAERAAAERRRVVGERSLVAVDRLAALVGVRAAQLDGLLAELHDRRRRQSEEAREVARALEGLRRARTDAERRLETLREQQRRAELEEAEVKLRLEQAVELLRRDLETEPDTAMAVPAPELPEGQSAAARVRELDRELRLLGPINPLAVEEYTALQERHVFLEAQLEDVKTSRRELAKVIRAVDEEIQRVFAEAFVDVAANFEQLFGTLFPGGQGRLVLTQPDDLLRTGIEVEAKPSGKNVKKLSLLSGGERSLTALAFLFAVFRSRPSPFYVMDEVEAALDDVNLHRFLGLVEEFRGEAQLIIVSHQKRTMEAADVLYGVTMQPGGSSKVVTEKAAR